MEPAPSWRDELTSRQLILVPGDSPAHDVDFRLRVLAALDGVSPSIRWSQPSDRSAVSPGTERTLLGIRIDRRDDARATVFAEVTCQSQRSARQHVEAAWDGGAWRVTPAGVLSEW